MKLRGKEHTDALLQSMYWAAARGAVYGGMISLGLLAFVKYRAPGFLNNKSGFVRSMLFVSPPAFCTITSMEMGSREFERTRG